MGVLLDTGAVRMYKKPVAGVLGARSCRRCKWGDLGETSRLSIPFSRGASGRLCSRGVLLSLLLLVLSMGIYHRALGYGFCSDDHRLIEESPRVKSFAAWRETFMERFFAPPDFPFLPYWRPLVLLSYAGDYHLWALRPGGYHFTGLMVNALNGVLVFLLFLAVFGDLPGAFATALLFTLHPTHVEPVVWISGRPDLLVSLFSLLFLWLFHRSVIVGRWRFYPFALLAFGAALLSKESGVMLLPAAGLLLWMTDVRRWAVWWRSLLPLLATVGLYLWAHALAIGAGVMRIALDATMFRGFLRAVGSYFRFIILPFFARPYSSMWTFEREELLLSLLGLLGFTVVGGIIRWRRIFPRASFSLIFLLFLLPVILPGLVPSYPPVLKRFAYLPSIFWGALLVDLGQWISHAWLKKIGVLFLAIILGIQVWVFTPAYRDDLAFENMMMRDYPDTWALEPRVGLNRALALAQQGRMQEALGLTELVLQGQRQNPWVSMSDTTRLFRANLLLLTGQGAEAEKEIRSVLGGTPGQDDRYRGYLLLGMHLERQGYWDDALDALGKAAAVCRTAEILGRQAVVLARMGRFQDAWRALAVAEELYPGNPKHQALKAWLETKAGGPEPSAGREIL